MSQKRMAFGYGCFSYLISLLCGRVAAEFAFATDKGFTANTAGHLLKDRLRSGFRFDDVIKRLAGPIMTVTACGGLIEAVFVVLFSVWLSRRRVEGLSADEAPAKTSERARIAGWRLRRQHRAPNNPAGA